MSDEDVIRWADCVPTPWRNGGGITREVAAHPPTGEEFDWRLSIADVEQPGPFSAFADVDRVITLLEGEQMVLEFDDERVRLVPFEPYAFPGEAACTGVLPDGATRDLNVMTRRGRTQAQVRVHRSGERIRLPAVDGTRLLVAIADGLAVQGTADNWTLGRYDTLRCDALRGDTELTVDGGHFVEIVLV